jgi:uncharacterized membrane protein
MIYVDSIGKGRARSSSAWVFQKVVQGAMEDCSGTMQSPTYFATHLYWYPMTLNCHMLAIPKLVDVWLLQIVDHLVRLETPRLHH